MKEKTNKKSKGTQKKNVKNKGNHSKNFKLKMITGIVIVIIVFVGVPLFNYYVVPKNVNTSVFVTSGMSLNQIRDTMGFKNKTLNKLYDAVMLGRDRVDMGYYEFSSKESFISLTYKLTHPSADRIMLTFPEGYSVAQIEQLLVSKGILTSDEFEEALSNVKDFPYPTPGGNFEGYMFPSTYGFYKSEPPQDVVETFLQEFISLYPPTKYADKETLYKQLIVASIVQKEVNQNSAMPTVAGLFYNRLNTGMRLQSDATVTYATGDQTLNLTKTDLSSSSPYNTYRVSGLPPTPICNPGKVAISAAIHPESTNYFYFLTTSNGSVIYATTYNEQLANEAEYLGK